MSVAIKRIIAITSFLLVNGFVAFMLFDCSWNTWQVGGFEVCTIFSWFFWSNIIFSFAYLASKKDVFFWIVVAHISFYLIFLFTGLVYNFRIF